MKIYNIKSIDIGAKETRIMMSENYLFLVLNRWLELNNYKEEIENILIKVILPDAESLALDKLKNGYLYKKEKYCALITSTGLMKKEERTIEDGKELKGKLEYIFIKEKYINFVMDFYNIISLGKIEEKLNTKEKMYINKDIIARLSLATSSTEMIKLDENIIDKIVVLKEKTYKHIAEYQTINAEKLENGEVELNNAEKKECEFTFSDGFGLGSETLFNKISEIKGYKIDYAVIRLYNGLACKGVVCRFNWNNYIKDNLNKANDDYFKVIDNKYYAKDIFNEWVNVSDALLILNETQVKWCKWWNSKEEIKDNIEKFKEYYDLNNSLYISRVNNKDEKEYTKCNYQLLNVLNITPREIKELITYDLDMYKSITDKDTYKLENSFDRKMIQLGDYSKEEIGDNFELSASTKIHKLLQIDKKFSDLKSAKTTICNNIRKSVNQLAGGKFYIKGNYKTIAENPIDIINLMLTGHLEEPILKDNECYVYKELGKRTLARNPIANMSEVQKVELVENEELERYLGKDFTKELIFFPRSNICSLMSGADKDGDECLVTNNQTIYNSVINTIPFFHNDNIKADKLEFTIDNMYYSIVKGSGAIINKISTTLCKINTLCQDIPYLFKNKRYYSRRFLYEFYYYKNKESIDKKIYDKIKELYFFKYFLKNNPSLDIKTFKRELISLIGKIYLNINNNNNLEKEQIKRLWDIYHKAKKEFNEINLIQYEIKNNYFTKWMDKQLASGNLIDMQLASDEKIKAIINEQFEELKPYIYLLTDLSMYAIDTPKTLVQINKKHLNLVKECLKVNIDEIELYNYDKSYPYFLRFTKDYIKNTEKMNRCALNYGAKYIKENCLDNINNILANGINETNLRLIDLLKVNTNAETNDVLVANIIELKSKYSSIVKINRISSENKRKENWNKLEHEANELLKDFKGIEFDDTKSICLKNLNVSNSFIINYFFDLLMDNLDTNIKANVYIQDDSGEIEWMHKHYRKENCHLAKEKAIKIRCKLDHDLKINGTEKIYKKDNKLYANNNLIGEIYLDYLEKINEEEIYYLDNYLIDKSKKGCSLFIKMS